MEENNLNVDTEEIQETEIQNTEDNENIEATSGIVEPFQADASFSPPIIQLEGVNYSYYEVAYKEQIKTNVLLMTILIAYITIFACTRFYRWFRSIFTITI